MQKTESFMLSLNEVIVPFSSSPLYALNLKILALKLYETS